MTRNVVNTGFAYLLLQPDSICLWWEKKLRMRGKSSAPVRAMFCFLPYNLTNPIAESLMTERKLLVFLCQASRDKPIVCELYQRPTAKAQ
jgi:hypothetical protein